MAFKKEEQVRRNNIVNYILSRCKDSKQVLVSDLVFENEISNSELAAILRKMVAKNLIHRCTVVGAGQMMNNIIASGPVPPIVDGSKDLEPVQVTIKHWSRGEHKRNEFESLFFGAANVQV